MKHGRRGGIISIMKVGNRIPDYYRETYVPWYRWFSRYYDLFVPLLLFMLNGGFGGERRLRELVIDRLELKPGDRVIDICSGTGTLAIMIGNRLAGLGQGSGPPPGGVAGIEISDRQMAVAMNKSIPANVELARADAQAVPYPDARFDKGVIFGALHEIPGPARRNILAEAYRVLKPGARTVILEHNRPEGRWRALFYRLLERPTPEYPTYSDLLESGLSREIAEAGFRVMSTEAVASQFFQVVVARKP